MLMKQATIVGTSKLKHLSRASGMVMKKSDGMSKSNASLRGSSCGSSAMRRAAPACRRLMRARVQKCCRRGFPVCCCGMSSAGGCPGASLAAASKTEPAKAPVSVRMCSQHPANALARGSPEAMNCLYRSSDLAKSSPVPTASTRCSAKPGRIEPSSSGSSVVLLTVPNRFQNSFR